MSKKENWIWQPHPGHFCLSDRCKFHLNTYVGGYIVSTVGELWNDREVRRIHARIHNPEWHELNDHRKGDDYDNAYFKQFGYEDIGYERKYETMVFKSKKMEESECGACKYRIIVSKDVDYDAYNSPEEAYAGHMKLCKKWGSK